MDERLSRTLELVSSFYDQRKVGLDIGSLGFRRSTDLKTLLACLAVLEQEGLMGPESMFLDMGCGDGRVNVLVSYLVKVSVGIEVDEWTLEEYVPLKKELEHLLGEHDLYLPPANIHLFHGDATCGKIYEEMQESVGVGLEDFDFFYTYLIMHEEFSRIVQEKAKPGAIFMVYGVDKVLPSYQGLELLKEMSPLGGILALYEKKIKPQPVGRTGTARAM